MTSDPPNLEYAPPPRRRARWYRRARTWVPLAVVVLVAWRYGLTAWHYARVAYLQWACGRYAAPPGTVACDEPGRWGGLTPQFLAVAPDPEPLQSLTAFAPDLLAEPRLRIWPAPTGTIGPAIPNALIFLSWRTTAGGKRCLVVIRRMVPADRKSWDAPVAFHAVAAPFIGSPWSVPPPVWSGFLPEVVPQVYTDDPTKVAVRFYAGQPDPADGSRFTIGFEVEGQPGTVDGQLVDALDEPGGVRVELKTR